MVKLWVVLLPVLSLVSLVPAYFWFRAKHYGALRFFLAAAAGVFAVLPAGLVQYALPLSVFPAGSSANLLFGVFVRVSLVEEIVRFAFLFTLFKFFPQSRIVFNGQDKDDAGADEPFFGAPSGIAAGFGFAAGESLFYGLTDIRVMALRMLTAAPLHAACGARLGQALGTFRNQPVFAVFLFVSAFIIHSIYNLSVLNPRVPWFLSVVIAAAALGSSLVSIHFGDLEARKRKSHGNLR